MNPSYHLLTPERWADFQQLFGPRGACAGCWCMYWRLPGAVFQAQKGDDNRLAMQAMVHTGDTPGILAYVEDQAVGWCSIAPREAFPTLARSRILQPVDDQPVWSIVCFFVARKYRRQGVSQGLISAAVDYARQNGATIVEAYPTEPEKALVPDVFIFTGLASVFRKAGFMEVARRSKTRPLMRYMIS